MPDPIIWFNAPHLQDHDTSEGHTETIGKCVVEVLKYGSATKRRRYFADVHTVVREEGKMLRICDNGKEVHPKEVKETPSMAESRQALVAMAKKIDYYNNAVINTLTVRF